MRVSDQIARWAAATTWDDLPYEVRERAVATLRDTVSVMIAGTRTRSATIAADVARQSEGTVPLMAGGTSSLGMAAFANGVAGSALDYDDGHYLGGAIHPSSPTLAAALATADESTTVKDLLTAHVVGLEVCLRAASLLWAKHPEDWYHSAGCSGALGAAAASAHLRGLDEVATQRAIVIAFQHAPMASVAFPMIKESIGWGATTGATAAQLAEAGWITYADGSASRDAEKAPADNPFDRLGVDDDPFVMSFGSTYESMNTYRKTYAACRYLHAAAWGTRTLMDEGEVTSDQVEAIEVRRFSHGSEAPLFQLEPKSLEHLQYSIPNVVAAVAVHGKAGPIELCDDRLDDAERLAMARRVDIITDESLDKEYPRRYPARIRLRCLDGRILEGTYMDAPDDREALTADQLTAKWTEAVGTVLSADTGQRLLDELGSIDRPVQDVLAPVFAAISSRR